MSHMLSLSSPHESAKTCPRVTTRALGKETGASCQSISWWFTLFPYISLSAGGTGQGGAFTYLHFSGQTEEMLSCRSRGEDFFPFSRCKKIFQFCDFSQICISKSNVWSVCCHGWQLVRALGSAASKGMHSHSSSSSSSLSSSPFGAH